LPKSDVVITVSDYFCDIIPAMSLKRTFNAKWIAWIHHCEANPASRPGSRTVNTITSKMQAWSFKRIARHADAAWINDTVAGDEIERRLLALGMPAKRIRRMKNGVDASAINACGEPQAGKSVDAMMIGVRPNKGMHDIIPIWERLCALRPGTTLSLTGGMSGEAGLEREIARRGLPIRMDRPNTGGFLPASEYYAKIKEARILFAPSHEEGWGIAVCEAMAAGLPVVAYDLPAYRKIYEGAYVPVPCFDHDAFARSIAAILNDSTQFAEMKERGLATAMRYDWNRIAEDDEASLRML